MKDFRLKSIHFILLLFVAGAGSLLLSVKKPVSDFGNYYYGAKFAAEGRDVNKEVYDVLQFNTNVAVEGETDFFLNHNTVSPQTMLLYRPFAWIGNAALSRLLFGLFSLGLFLFSLNRFLKRLEITNQWAMVVVFISALIPLYYNALFGQSYLLVAALIMESVLLSEEKFWLAALCLSIAVALKLSPAIVLLYFLTEKKYRVVGLTLFFWLLITGLTAMLINGGKSALSVFYLDSLPRMMSGFISDPYSSSQQSFIVFLRKLCSPDEVLQPSTLIPGSESLCYLINALFVLVMSVVLVGAWKRSASVRKKLLLLFLFVNFTSGYTSSYALLLLLPFIELQNDTRSWIRALLYAVVFMFPPRIFDGWSPFLEEYKLWIFIALFFMEATPGFSFRRIERPQLLVGLVFLAMICFRFAQRPEILPLNYLSPQQVNADFVLGAYIREHSIVCLVPSDNGYAERTIELDTAYRYEPTYALDESERYHHVQIVPLTTYQDNIYVLSDYHRGPGLFHLYWTTQKDWLQLNTEE